MFSDWLNYFWTQLLNPGTIQPEIFNLPWLFIVLQPLRFLGEFPALIVVQLTTIGIIIVLCRKMRISWGRIILVLFSAPVFSHVVMGQIDGLILLAYLLPPILAAGLVLCKPQTALWAGWAAFRTRPIPVISLCIILVVSAFIIWGWPFSVIDPKGYISVKWTLTPPFFQHEWNWSLFPWSILITPFVLKKSRNVCMLLSPFLFPYVALNSLIGPIIAAATFRWYVFIGIWMILWIRWAWMADLIKRL
jgi:hypothetical protein